MSGTPRQRSPFSDTAAACDLRGCDRLGKNKIIRSAGWGSVARPRDRLALEDPQGPTAVPQDWTRTRSLTKEQKHRSMALPERDSMHRSGDDANFLGSCPLSNRSPRSSASESSSSPSVLLSEPPSQAISVVHSFPPLLLLASIADSP